jgi:hypothetical protein
LFYYDAKVVSLGTTVSLFDWVKIIDNGNDLNAAKFAWLSGSATEEQLALLDAENGVWDGVDGSLEGGFKIYVEGSAVQAYVETGDDGPQNALTASATLFTLFPDLD